jgi:hypothetical protein
MASWFDKTFLFLYDDWSRVVFPEIENTDHLHIVVKSPIPNDKIQDVVEYSKKFDFLSLVIPHSVSDKYDLSFLECFPKLNSFALTAHLFNEFDQLSYIPDGIEEITINATNSLRLSLSFLTRFKNLKSVSLEKHKKDIEALSEIQQLEKLAIKSITLPDLGIIKPLSKLKELEIRLGGTKNLDLLPTFKNLEYLELWAIHKIVNIDPIADSTSLRKLFLDGLKNVENVKSLKELTNLKSLGLCRMKGLKSLKWAADAPKLEEFSITQTTHLDKSSFEPFLGHRALRAANIYIGKKHSAEVRGMLELPEIEVNNG